MPNWNENILVFPRNILDEQGNFQGLNFDYVPYFERIFSPGAASFIPRDEAEYDPSRKQIIPYVLLAWEDQVLFYVRGKQAGESRLVSKGSVGFGGHIRAEDDSMFHDPSAPAREIYQTALEREVREELVVDSPYEDRVVAVLNDDSNDVGRVHFGIIHVWRLAEPEVKKREQEITQVSFMKPEELRRQKVELETWSQICLDNIEDLLLRAAE